MTGENTGYKDTIRGGIWSEVMKHFAPEKKLYSGAIFFSYSIPVVLI